MSLELSYLGTPRTKPLLYTTIGERTQHWANEFPNKTALVVRTQHGRNTITYRDLYDKSLTFAKFLIRADVKPGHIIGVFLTNSSEWLIANVGISLAGASSLNSYGFMQDTNFDWLLSVGCAGLVIDLRDDSISDEILWKVTKLHTDAHSESRSFPIVYMSNTDLSGCDHSDWYRFDRVINQLEQIHIELPIVQPESPGFIFQSSGSTGTPKNIVHSHVGLINSGDCLADLFDYTDDDVYWSPRPLGYGSGFPALCFSRGATVVTAHHDLRMRDDFSELSVKIMVEEGVTVGYLSPYFVFDLDKIRHKFVVLPKFKCMRVAGQRISKTSMVKLIEFADKAFSSYGLVEAYWSCQNIVSCSQEAEDDVMGNPIPGVEVKVVDDNGAVVPVGVCGEIYIRSRFLFSHYILHDGRKYDPKTPEGWLPTGDIGVIMADGRSYIKGRKVEVIKRYAAKIFPANVESLLLMLPDIEEACVVGTPDDRMYEDIVAVVTLKKGSSLTIDELEKLAVQKFKPSFTARETCLMPGFMFIVKSIAKLVTGKINRKNTYAVAQQLVMEARAAKNS